jgi:diguanylate cyclase (GGDEF)-like protein
MTMAETAPTLLATLGADLRRDSWEVAVEVVEEGLRDEALASLARVGRAAQLGDMATFIAELGREIAEPAPGPLKAESPLVQIVRGHAGAREALGFGPREVVTELMLLRRVLRRYVSAYPGLSEADVLEVEERLNDSVDRLAVECVGAYFDRAAADMSEHARRDSLTSLLNNGAFSDVLARELERARRYERGLALVLLDLDGFGHLNNTRGRAEGDRVLRRVGSTALSMLRGSDVAGRLDGDEFGVLLLEADTHAADRFLRRLSTELGRLCEHGELPEPFSYSAGAAHYPTEAEDTATLIRLAGARQLDAKRAR